MSKYVPSTKILEKYAEVLVNFALNSGKGVKKGEVVRLVVPESAKPLYVALRNQIIKSKAHPLSFYLPEGVNRSLYELSEDFQLSFFPRHYMNGLAREIDHSISVISETDKHELEGVNPDKIMKKLKSGKPFKDLIDQKENEGKYTWTLALFGTESMAKEAGLSLSSYWDQIIKACFLDTLDPISKWKEVTKENDRIKAKLNAISLSKLHVVGPDVDLWISLGDNRRWLGGSGRNIPSFEIFTSPDWRGTNGWIRFNQPLYRYGSVIRGVSLEFKDGLVVKSTATKNQSLLRKMISVENANKIGEFSLTDRRLSRINKFMAETLFDENISGPYGNTHVALGASYVETYDGSQKELDKRKKLSLGFNDSVIHTDIISTSDRTVFGITSSGESLVIYQKGKFTF